MTPEPIIGIFGVTPEGAAKAYRDLSVALFGKYGDYMNPHMLLYMQPLIFHVQSFGDEAAWTALIKEGLGMLARNGARLIWMPANSSHLVAEHCNIEGAMFFNMVDASIEALAASPGKPLVLGTTLSMSEKLYFRDERVRARCAKPDGEDQKRINDIIVRELILGNISAESMAFFIRTVEKYRASDNITSVFFACTELPCFFGREDFAVPVDDCIRVSIDGILSALDNIPGLIPAA